MSLRQRILKEIAETGPMPIDRYMAICLSDPEHGYYTTRDPFGTAGDFITAPEVSQMYGEMLGIWIASVWQQQGAPRQFTLAELGPGRGTLTKDVLRVLQKLPGAAKAAQPHLIETSPTLRQIQSETLKDEDITWLDGVEDLPDAPLFLFANEFFDALPIKQFQKVDNVWMERCVTVKAGELHFGLQPSEFRGPSHLPDGAIVERSDMAVEISALIARRISEHGGAALYVDYGDRSGEGDTLQAVQSHKHVDIFTEPGLCDLTAHVRFGDLEAAELKCHFTDQGHFLERLGITARANALLQAGDRDAVAAHRRLTHPDAMGNLFKVLAMVPKSTPIPPGFDT